MDGNEAAPASRRAGAGAPRDELQAPGRADAPAEAPPSPEPTSRDEPSNAGPSNAEPSNAEPANAEPSNAEPANAEPAHGEPTADGPPPGDSTTGSPSPSDSTTEAPPIFDLPAHGAGGGADDKASGNGDDTELPPGNGDRTLVLGGAAAAEGRTTGPNPRIAGPLPAESRHASGGNGRAGVDDEPSTGSHFRQSPSTDRRDGGPPRWALALAAPISPRLA